MAADIVLTTFNARYSHASLGLRSLKANLGPFRDRCVLAEATLSTRPLELVERILAHQPRIVGVGVYVWNTDLSAHLVALIKQLSPQTTVVLGGPEVSHEIDAQAVCQRADYVVRGEGENAFLRICEAILAPRSLSVMLPKVIDGGEPELDRLADPYAEYSVTDIAERVVYVEASRGCPFRCAFCLSALDRRVRTFPPDRFLAALDGLHHRGVRRFKFVDRTFNLAIDDAMAILTFFLARNPEDLFLHFEMIPDRLPERLVELVGRFPPGVIQLEVGIQTLNPTVSAAIERRTNLDRALHNIEILRQRTRAHVHADLIAGLPEETWGSFEAGFNRLVAAGPQEIQLGILKRLRGAPLTHLPGIERLVFDEKAPYEVLMTPTMSFEELTWIRRCAWVWDHLFNRGKAPATTTALLDRWHEQGSVFAGLMAFTQRVVAYEPTFFGLGLRRLIEHAYDYLVESGVEPTQAAEVIQADFRPGRVPGQPSFLFQSSTSVPSRRSALPSRQRRHVEL